MLPPATRVLISFATLFLLTLAACSSQQVHSTSQEHAINLSAPDLQQGGIAFVTPSSVTGQEEDRQALAFTFSEVLRQSRPQLKIMDLPQTLSAINRAGLTLSLIHI